MHDNPSDAGCKVQGFRAYALGSRCLSSLLTHSYLHNILVAGSCDLAITSCVACYPTYSTISWPYKGYPNHKQGCKTGFQ